jgi:hypothetical protein
MILKHASRTLLELLQYRCKTKTCSCNPDHPPHLSSLGRHFRYLHSPSLHGRRSLKSGKPGKDFRPPAMQAIIPQTQLVGKKLYMPFVVLKINIRSKFLFFSKIARKCFKLKSFSTMFKVYSIWINWRFTGPYTFERI